ncbi:hypothetical protein I79_008410 [Cricetulus griseus]|uniref:Uncharacterized protein n=1 Tax=Cricetulus griseus TaxID=10029 RepID=G3HD37_CRIGR|nr:hypothetical protein I79_008410 [Cricetulus griseus]
MTADELRLLPPNTFLILPFENKLKGTMLIYIEIVFKYARRLNRHDFLLRSLLYN